MKTFNKLKFIKVNIVTWIYSIHKFYDFKVLKFCTFKPFLAIVNEKQWIKSLTCIFEGQITLASYFKSHLLSLTVCSGFVSHVLRCGMRVIGRASCVTRGQYKCVVMVMWNIILLFFIEMMLMYWKLHQWNVPMFCGTSEGTLKPFLFAFGFNFEPLFPIHLKTCIWVGSSNLLEKQLAPMSKLR